jgi:hypothetical protein
MVSQQLVNIKPYTHHTTVDSTHLRCKAMRYENPVVAIQQCQAKDEIREHFRSVYNDKGNNRQPCEACGTQTTWRCGLCEKAMCTTTKSGVDWKQMHSGIPQSRRLLWIISG